MKKIIFRADGNSDTGLGHLYRIFALIEFYKETCECILVTHESSITSIIPKEYKYSIIPRSVSTEQEPQWLKTNHPDAGTWIIADGYQFTSAWQKAIKHLEFKLAYVDDLCAEHMYADVVINHSLQITPANYKAEAYTRFALGTQYAILRPQFSEAAKNKRGVDTITTAFVCFGGADAFDLTLKAAQALLNNGRFTCINCVVGAAYKHRYIFELAKQEPRLNVHQNLSEHELITVMKTSGLGIAPASTILYELCCVKMPVLSGYYVANQKNIYAGALQMQLIYDGGNFETYTVSDFENKINALLANNNFQSYSDAQASVFDGKAKERFINLLSMHYRTATSDDMLLVYNWANDKLSRANSYFSEPIALETHKAWFERKLQDKNTFIYIAEKNNEPAGMVRYEVSEDHAAVGILVSENFRGQGLAAELLMATAQLYSGQSAKPVLAYIKKENTASVKSFEKAGYTLLRNETVHGCESFVYSLSHS